MPPELNSLLFSGLSWTSVASEALVELLYKGAVIVLSVVEEAVVKLSVVKEAEVKLFVNEEYIVELPVVDGVLIDSL